MLEDIMKKRTNTQSPEPATKADLRAMKTVIIEAVKDTLSVVMETAAETKEGVTELKGLMNDMLEELTATHEDVRYVRNTVTMLVKTDAAHEAAIESLRKRVERAERKVGITK
jgi:hypothetical protein